MSHNPMDFNNDGKSNYTDFMIHQTTMNQYSSSSSSGTFQSIFEKGILVVIGFILFAISPVLGVIVVVLCLLFFINANTPKYDDDRTIEELYPAPIVKDEEKLTPEEIANLGIVGMAGELYAAMEFGKLYTIADMILNFDCFKDRQTSSSYVWSLLFSLINLKVVERVSCRGHVWFRRIK